MCVMDTPTGECVCDGWTPLQVHLSCSLPCGSNNMVDASAVSAACADTPPLSIKGQEVMSDRCVSARSPALVEELRIPLVTTGALVHLTQSILRQ